MARRGRPPERRADPKYLDGGREKGQVAMACAGLSRAGAKLPVGSICRRMCMSSWLMSTLAQTKNLAPTQAVDQQQHKRRVQSIIASCREECACFGRSAAVHVIRGPDESEYLVGAMSSDPAAGMY